MLWQGKQAGLFFQMEPPFLKITTTGYTYCWWDTRHYGDFIIFRYTYITYPACFVERNASGFQNTNDQRAYQMKSVFIPTSSPNDSSCTARSRTSAMVADGCDIQNDPFLVGCVDSINKQLGLVNVKSELVDVDGLMK